MIRRTLDPRDSGIAAIALAVGSLLILVGLGAVAIALLRGGDGPTRQEEVAARGADVMPFDLDRTTHRFTPTATGGIQSVVADDARDATQIRRVRRHLRAEAERFRRGDFGDPAMIHGHDMPGLRVLRASARELSIEVDPTPDGATLTYRSGDPEIVGALHDWFAAQRRDHGAHAAAG